jgi:hypothetical protein
MVTKKEIEDLLKAAIDPLKKDITDLKKTVEDQTKKVEDLTKKVEDLTKAVKVMDDRAKGLQSVKHVRLHNCRLAPNQPLRKLKYNLNGDPLPANLEQPSTWAHLVGAGNELVPGGSVQDNANKWNRQKSRKFLQDVMNVDASDGSDSEESRRACASRRAVARALGVDMGAYDSHVRLE